VTGDRIGGFYSANETFGIGDALASDVKSGAMVGRGSHNRKAQGDVDAAPKVQGFKGYQSLVVVHAYGGVIGLSGFGVK